MNENESAALSTAATATATATTTTTESAWRFAALGWPAWLVLPLILVAVVGICWLLIPQLRHLMAHHRWGLLLLRGSIAAILVGLFLEPTLATMRQRQELPVVTVLVDQSGSMQIREPELPITAALNEAQHIGLITSEQRDTRCQDLAQLWHQFHDAVLHRSQQLQTTDDGAEPTSPAATPTATNPTQPNRLSHLAPTQRQEWNVPNLSRWLQHHAEQHDRFWTATRTSPTTTQDSKAADLSTITEVLPADLQQTLQSLATAVQDAASDLQQFPKGMTEPADSKALVDWFKALQARLTEVPAVVAALAKLQEQLDEAELAKRRAEANQAESFLQVSTSPDTVTTTAPQNTSLATTATQASDSWLSAIETMRRRRREQRALQFLQQRLLPQLNERASVRLFGFDQQLRPLPVTADGLGTFSTSNTTGTDLELALAEVARRQASEHLGGVVVLSDGRATVGGTPNRQIQLLRSRGVFVQGITVGTPESPPDATVAEIVGKTEVFLKETVTLDVRFRIQKLQDTRWELRVLRREGDADEAKLVARRNVVADGTGAWQYERFEFPADQLGTMQVQAELIPLDSQRLQNLLAANDPVIEEIWTDIPNGKVVELIGHSRYREPPALTRPLDNLEGPSLQRENYGARVRGYLLPPETGSYTFFVTGDDETQLWLSQDDQPDGLRQVARVEVNVNPGDWKSTPLQTSRALALRANQPIYFEVLHKQGGGMDHWGVGWRLPNGTEQKPIPRQALAAYQMGSLIEPTTAPAAESMMKEASTSNNAVETLVSVTQDPLRVLLVDAWPRWESRYLASLFERDQRVELIRRYRSIRVARGEFEFLPTSQEELDRFDTIILGDLNADEIRPEDQERLERFVGERAGFVVFLAGPRGMPAAFNLGPLADLLPVRPTGPVERSPRAVRCQLTALGAESPLLAVLRNPSANEKLWPLLPPLQWVATNLSAKSAATVLLASNDDRKLPLVVLQQYGAGRVLWVSTPETWRWRDRLGDLVHQTFWNQALRWGMGVRLRGADTRLQVSLDRSLLHPGESAQLRGRAILPDGQFDRQPLRVTLERLRPSTDGNDALDESQSQPSSAPLRYELQMVEQSATAGIWGLTLADLPPGRWRATVRSANPALAGLYEQRELLIHRRLAKEEANFAADPARLAEWSRLGGTTPAQLADANLPVDWLNQLQPRTIRQLQSITLWDNFGALLLILALLTVEWIWRKRVGLP